MKRILNLSALSLLFFLLLQLASHASAPFSIEEEEPFSVEGTIVPAGQAPSLTCEEGAGTPAAWLAVHGNFPERHVYSLTQPKGSGGSPTVIKVTLPDEEDFIVGSFTGATPVENVDFMGNTLEEWKEEFDAVAPVWVRADSETSALSPEERYQKLVQLAPSGKIDAICCDDNNCVPVREKFSFRQAERTPDFDALLTAAYPQKTAETGIKNGTPTAEPPAPFLQESGSLWRNLLYAFFGGMILNIMPCVLPVIGLKIVSFFEQAGKSRARAFYLNLCYTAGILTVFTVLALMSVGLSYLFTYGIFQIVMGAVVFAMALNLMGVWEITLPNFLGGQQSNRLMGKEGGFGGWFKGVITTLLAIPCGAPLLSPALVWTDSLMKNGAFWSVLVIYWVIGLGMAAPFLIIGAFPELLRFLPKPGQWMETFKNLMGFVLLFAILWILYSMPLPLILPMTAFLFAVWFSCWLLGKNQFDPDRKPFRTWLAALLVPAAVLLFSFEIPRFVSADGTYPIPTLERAFRGKLTKWGIRASREGMLTESSWSLFDPARFEKELNEGKTVMIDFTADWCMNCKVLESTVLRSPEIEKLVAEKGIVTMTGDWTNRGDSEESRAVGDLLRQYGGEQVPVVMIFSPERRDTPVVLRGLFSKGTLLQKLKGDL